MGTQSKYSLDSQRKTECMKYEKQYIWYVVCVSHKQMWKGKMAPAYNFVIRFAPQRESLIFNELSGFQLSCFQVVKTRYFFSNFHLESCPSCRPSPPRTQPGTNHRTLGGKRFLFASHCPQQQNKFPLVVNTFVSVLSMRQKAFADFYAQFAISTSVTKKPSKALIGVWPNPYLHTAQFILHTTACSQCKLQCKLHCKLHWCGARFSGHTQQKGCR